MSEHVTYNTDILNHAKHKLLSEVNELRMPTTKGIGMILHVSVPA